MSSRRPRPAHQEAVQRRLALLSAELAGLRDETADDDVVGGRSGGRGGPGGAGGRPDRPADPVLEHTRVASSRRAAVVLAPPPHPAAPDGSDGSDGADEGPRALPVPGRHAARRPGTCATLVPATLRGRFALSPATLALVAVLAAVGLAVTCWVVVRADARPLAAPRLSSGGLATPVVPATPAEAVVAGSGTASAGAGGAMSGPAAGQVTVDVAGRVRRPGIVVLPAGSRVVDALEAAGGARPHVDLSSLNLARLLTDGEQIVVAVGAPVGAAGPVPTSTAAPPTGAALVNLNTADESQLDTLPEVGPVTAGAIVAWRTEHGGFTAVEELLEVDGIGDATLAQIAPYVTV
ncbi:helix-hairpin-helix domain-containing protein [Nocardioides taihuensis]|uniref:Helix-hairpin-helix domain-containing protein n=1 Tax=Nocardioides taihuensis TaxID=1835606 RepID=A0ABW0BMG3_9ACTN